MGCSDPLYRELSRVNGVIVGMEERIERMKGALLVEYDDGETYVEVFQILCETVRILKAHRQCVLDTLNQRPPYLDMVLRLWKDEDDPGRTNRQVGKRERQGRD